jgi:pimeloyl-ACP methyl ester carboxylesterase
MPKSSTIPDGRCVIAFRGTQPGNVANVWDDVDLIVKTWPPMRNNGSEPAGAPWCPGCLVHVGFAQSYEEIRLDMLAAIDELNCASFVLTGHSLGAAVATLASMELRAGEGKHVASVYTFGKPRVGDRSFVEEYIAAAEAQNADPPMWRIVHNDDPIPRLNNLMGCHEPVEVFYNASDASTYRICNSTLGELEDQTCMVSTPFTDWSYPDHMRYFDSNFTLPRACHFRTDLAGMSLMSLVPVMVILLCGLLCTVCCYRQKWCCNKREPTTSDSDLEDTEDDFTMDDITT